MRLQTWVFKRRLKVLNTKVPRLVLFKRELWPRSSMGPRRK